MKKPYLSLLTTAAVFFFFILSSCKKINEPTQIGDELIPPIDNITTFETFLSTITDNKITEDTTLIATGDVVALGHINNDPEFGQTDASVFFDLAPSAIGTNPFVHRDSVIAIDSVVLSLAYEKTYGDSLGMQTVRVFEIDQDSDFNDSTLYRFSGTGFPTTGTELGSKTFAANTLNDSITIVRAGDTTKTANVLRIPIDLSLGERFSLYDTTNTFNGGFRNDSIFKSLFKGLAIKADASGNTLNYFDLNDATNTKLTVYYRVTRNGKPDTTATNFVHKSGVSFTGIVNGKANIITRNPSGEWANYLANGTAEDDKVYLQSSPGSFATIKIPGLDTLQNSIIHKAELIIYRIPSALDNIFTPPSQLMLDKLNASGDSAFILQKDFLGGGSLDYLSFGGQLRSNTSFRFNITRYVQDIVTLNEPNMTLRLHAPLRTVLYGNYPDGSKRASIQGISEIANGRVVLAGGNYADPNLRMQLRVVYSKI